MRVSRFRLRCASSHLSRSLIAKGKARHRVSRWRAFAVSSGIYLLGKSSEKVQNYGMVTEVQWSELQRDPKEVARLADEGDVRVRRRDGVPLLLVREDRAHALSEGSVAAARALRNVLVHLPPDVAARALIDEFPWVDVLPESAQAAFVNEFARAFQASAELGEWSVLSRTVQEWRSTAAIYADPVLAEQLSGPIDDDFGAVPEPMGE
ncbi:hypothetical protein [Nocardia cyriacigeorgica]|uniref:hypothetical protein n=1 Tax=Nocardia cyriacigeorgica TaxID=135487 RepID=UPI0024541B7C|nr:hypothetical protein [Nocardia cyriacigeorgica]